MVSGPFRDPNASLLRRIDELERANRRLRSRLHQSFVTDLSSFLRIFARVIATMICVAGALVIGFVVLGLFSTLVLCVVAFV